MPGPSVLVHGGGVPCSAGPPGFGGPGVWGFRVSGLGAIMGLGDFGGLGFRDLGFGVEGFRGLGV